MWMLLSIISRRVLGQVIGCPALTKFAKDASIAQRCTGCQGQKPTCTACTTNELCGTRNIVGSPPCLFCNAKKTVCGYPMIGVGEDLFFPGSVLFSYRFQFTTGRLVTYIEQSMPLPDASVTGFDSIKVCYIEVDGTRCNSCEVKRCSSGLTQPSFDCSNIAKGATGTACTKTLAGGYFSIDKSAMSTFAVGFTMPYLGCQNGGVTASVLKSKTAAVSSQLDQYADDDITKAFEAVKSFTSTQSVAVRITPTNVTFNDANVGQATNITDIDAESNETTLQLSLKAAKVLVTETLKPVSVSLAVHLNVYRALSSIVLGVMVLMALL